MLKRILLAIAIGVGITTLGLIYSSTTNLGFGSVLVSANGHGWPKPYYLTNYQYGGDACFTATGCPSGGTSIDKTALIEDWLLYSLIAFCLIILFQKGAKFKLKE